MKESYCSIIAILLMCGYSCLFVSCSNELLITSPSFENKTLNLENFQNNSIVKPDTMVYLPLSKMKVGVSKGFTDDIIAKLDKYYSTHKVPLTSQNKINPMLPLCGTHYTFVWVPIGVYRSVPNKTLGIWLSTDVVSYSNAFSTYGFKKIFVYDNTSIDNAYSGGFSYDNMMFGVGSYYGATDRINSANTGGRHVGAYYIDEPIDKNDPPWNSSTITEIANHQYVSSTKLFLGSYHMATAWFNYPVTTFGQIYGPLTYLTNVYMMCDEYHGNCSGAVNDYWNEFKGYYISKNISDWLEIVANNGDGNTHVACPYINQTSTNWYDLLNNANINGINEVWLYAYGTGSITGVQNFCSTAWGLGWLQQEYAFEQVFWTCDDSPCQSCVWGSGDWSIESWEYLGSTEWQ